MDKPNNKVTLETPLQRGETSIAELELIKPNAGALRGVSLRGLLDFEADHIVTVLPRITLPALTAQEAQRLDPADLVQFGGIIAGFLLPKRVLAQAEAEVNASASLTA